MEEHSADKMLMPTIEHSDVWSIFVLLATGPITAVMYVAFALGYWVGHKLAPWPVVQTIWRYGYGTPFSILNLAYNLTVGSLMWWERPRFLQFTQRLKDQKKKNRFVAYFLCEAVNVFDPGHC